MSVSESDRNYLLNIFRRIPPSHVALLLRLIRLYPINIINDPMKREEFILDILNEVSNCDYKNDIWPDIMAINRVPELVEEVRLTDEQKRLLAAIDRLQCRFELQPHRFRIYQLIPTIKHCFMCKGQLGEPIFDEVCNIIGRNNVYQCVLYKNECCDFVYKYGHFRNRRTRERLILPDAIFKQEFIHLFDHVVYERVLLVAFTNLVYEAASNFQSYTDATNADIDQNRNLNNDVPIQNKLNSKYFAATWTWFELCRFLLFMTNFQTIQIPDIIQRLSHDMYYEANSNYFYEVFVKFWSRHGQAHRLVCAYTAACDESVPEMGAVAVGCPRAPLRASSSHLKNMSNIDRNKCKHYCSDHYIYGLQSGVSHNPSSIKAVELDRVSDEFESTDKCTVHRDEDDTENKRRTAGFMALVSNCNVIIGWNESVRSEGMRRSVYYLLRYLHLGGILPPAAAYDSACTFIAYLKNQYGISIKQSPYVNELLEKKYCIDRFHRRNHTRPDCKTILSCSHPTNKPFFDNENTQVCEQLFSHFTRLKASLRGISWPYSTIFYCIIFHLRNCFHTKIFPDNPYLAVKSNIPSPSNEITQWTQIMASNNYLTYEQNEQEVNDIEDNDLNI
ncbi:unnamed protein product [Rotaria socialis]|uniref:Uncharacterized protein n=1 Tax=Rotaria socialis TaxID=392032 RepID=A0A820SS48_9BILA|nr:unnamed protein product [Rotaria socialis]